ncbi:MAG: 50S ribosomal protein L19, partial [Nitrospinae bacterium]|nr:50S ribosomal protein L19 [Nitrospinota bacterium]
MNLVDQIERKEMKEKIPEVRIGDTARVHFRIVEGNKERVQVVEGVVIKMRGSQNRKTITVRKVSFGVGVERIFPRHSPRVEKV